MNEFFPAAAADLCFFLADPLRMLLHVRCFQTGAILQPDLCMQILKFPSRKTDGKAPCLFI